MTARTSAAESIWMPGRDERAARQARPMRREQRPGRPGDRREEDRGEPDRIERAGAADADGPTRIATPTKPTTMPTTASRGSRSPRKIRPRTATQTGIIAMSSAVMPGRDGLLAERDHAHPAAEQQRADDGAVAPLAPGRHDERAPVAGDRPGEQDQAGEQEPDGGHEERRDRLDRDRDRRGRSSPRRGRGRASRAQIGARAAAARPARRRWHRRMVQDNRTYSQLTWLRWSSRPAVRLRRRQAARRGRPADLAGR